MTDEERREAAEAYFRWKNPHAKRLRDDLAFDAGYAAACEAKQVEIDQLHSNHIDEAQSLLESLKAERARSAKLTTVLYSFLNKFTAMVQADSIIVGSLSQIDWMAELKPVAAAVAEYEKGHAAKPIILPVNKDE